MKSAASQLRPLLLALASLALCGSAWSAAVENPKPRNRLAAKVKPQAPAPAVVDEDNTPLNDDQLAVGPRVHSGDAQCEFNQKVQITPHPDKPGRFRLQFGKLVYNMTPEPTTTGAVRLEDKKAGVVWLQIPAKSMLMNAKIGQRMVDSCQHPEQVQSAQAMVAPDSGIGITPGTSLPKN
ncbi:hypothetical protein PFX98_18425 [Paucibacter sediminis]|uniref:Uncharacterized protein n=1 Tax=Paucibacter sediminis TaxID=3019553 RepID=A0AA95NJR8_9BURK|nr:hypothetical protein [Paucibacter sp. S2-9]WIT10871.1 hypothetical protein PFX98_18425 [Paucibacter sp. S2-9]